MKATLKHIAATAVFLVILFGLSAEAAAGDDKIAVERTGDTAERASEAPPLSTLEAEFAALTDRLSAGVTFEIESRRNDTSESATRRARVFVKDTQSVRVETSLPGGIELAITKSGNEGWIYFPKTNMIMELKNGGKDLTQRAGVDFIAGFTADRQDHLINRTDAPDGARRYEIVKKSRGQVVYYDFDANGALMKITVAENGRTDREIFFTKTVFGQPDGSLFVRPKNAFKMPVNEFPDFDY